MSRLTHSRHCSLPAIAAAAAVVSLIAPSIVSAQDDRLTVHGSVNVGYGKTDGIPYFGLNKDGTSDNRAVALQFGYRIDASNRIVTQLLHRKFGTSPQNAVEPAIQPIWAFYEHRFQDGTTLKLGRNPLPRGSFNEIRFIGTLLPFYRVGASVYGETLEYLDGAVVRRPQKLGNGFSLDASMFAGGFDVKAQVPTAEGNSVVSQREENLVGGQLWLNTPIQGVRFGTFAASWQNVPHASLAKSQRGTRTSSIMASGEAIFSRAFLRTEYTTFNTERPFLKYSGWYVLGGVSPLEHVTIAAEYSSGDNTSRLPNPMPELTLPVTRDIGLAVSYKPDPSVVFKLEGRRNTGYGFDVPVPTISPRTTAPFYRVEAPSRSYYGMLSVAVSF